VIVDNLDGQAVGRRRRNRMESTIGRNRNLRHARLARVLPSLKKKLVRLLVELDAVEVSFPGSVNVACTRRLSGRGLVRRRLLFAGRKREQ
jgi:hypothetical protein